MNKYGAIAHETKAAEQPMALHYVHHVPHASTVSYRCRMVRVPQVLWGQRKSFTVHDRMCAASHPRVMTTSHTPHPLCATSTARGQMPLTTRRKTPTSPCKRACAVIEQHNSQLTFQHLQNSHETEPKPHSPPTTLQRVTSTVSKAPPKAAYAHALCVEGQCLLTFFGSMINAQNMAGEVL
jgi:hypothetical protein